ncbi:uncharacterized protein LOC124275925 isoform X5 [Haliotis rubra]|uniref:uncharacterized protein LOC124275925 isoform X5 n=1 Tax=Haliotis rubra TaxID=36100 RepID=UPI001EE52FE8|nr:uncharacterized protein LOC124275925 isoform X5 [Haliotis rubra]
MEVSTIIFFSLLLCGVKAIYADASLAALAARVRLVEREINLWKQDAVNTDTKLIDKFEVLESSLKEELTERFLPLLIKPLVKQAITDIMNKDYIGNAITGHVLREVQSLKANVQNTKTQLKTLAEQLRRVERDRDTYRKSLRKQRRSLTKDIRELQIQLNHTVADLRDARTTTCPLTTAASTDPSPSNTASLAPVTTQDSDLHASTDPSPNTTVPPTPVTTEDPDPHGRWENPAGSLISYCPNKYQTTVVLTLSTCKVQQTSTLSSRTQDIATTSGSNRKFCVKHTIVYPRNHMLTFPPCCIVVSHDGIV